MKRHISTLCLIGALFVPHSVHGENQIIHVQGSRELSRALKAIKPGTTLLLKPGSYAGGIQLRNVVGEDKQPIVIQGIDPTHPPVFAGGKQAIHLSNCSHVTLRHMTVKGFPTNGINIDDGGSFETPAHHIVIEDLTIVDTGPSGNHDALKMSGVDHFEVRKCRIEGWGGSGIDMVGCHYGVVEDCTFVGRAGFSQSNGVQLKGGTADVLVQCCFFKHVGHRSINVGGSTGLQFFRPRVQDYEARNITVAGNRFVGSMAPVAWVTSNGGHVHHNTIELPEKWVLRILQETSDVQFSGCHDGVFEHNLILFDSRVQTFVNVGPRTSPESFRFHHNAWHDLDRHRKPVLPVQETDGVYLREISIDPTQFTEGQLEWDDKRVKGIGAHAYKRPG